MSFLKLVAISILCSLICVIVKQVRPEFLSLLQITSIIILVAFSLDSIRTLIDLLTEFTSSGNEFMVSSIFSLIKIFAVTVITKLAEEICNDSGNSTIGLCVELAGKIMIIFMCLPMIETILDIALSFLK